MRLDANLERYLNVRRIGMTRIPIAKIKRREA